MKPWRLGALAALLLARMAFGQGAQPLGPCSMNGSDCGGSSGGSGITTLNTLTADPQTFARVSDTNVTLSIGSSSSTHTFTLGWTGSLAAVRGGTGQTSFTLGDILYASGGTALSKLAGNTSAAKNFLCQTGTGSASAAPAWCTVVAGDVPTLNQNTTGSAGSVTGLSVISGKTLTVDKSIEFDGTDGTKVTFPSTNSVMARTDAANNFAASQAFAGNIYVSAGIDIASGAGSLTTAGFSSGWNASQRIGFGNGSGTVDLSYTRCAANVACIGTGAVGDGNGWLVTGGESRVSSDVTNATATMSVITGLSATVIAGRQYGCLLELKVSNSTASEGVSVDFDGSTATMTSIAAGAAVMTGGTTVAVTTTSSALSTDLNWTTITGETWIRIAVNFVVNASGTFVPRFCEGTAHTSGTATVSTNSVMRCVDIK